ncbi:mechanosensitive ion channel family protein [Algoriphagus terrigena]|uniref:mechanosensitive ion channel family protein n=1 Tax=Algoriphagus terrigena TaxID=344884 RepID=UPI0004141216|nr:mechanosensitive ion channel family protein [Algoriphagus terrigena]
MKRILPFFLICITVLSLGNEVHAKNIFQDSPAVQADVETAKSADPIGYPVLGAMQDTLFQIFSRSGSLTPKDRASRISSRIQVLAENDLYRSDSLKVEELEGTYDILYEDQIILSITAQDAKIHEIGLDSLATEWREVINSDLLHYQDENRLEAWAMRVGLTLAAILTAIGIFFFVQRASQKLIEWVTLRRERLFKNLAYRSYTYLTQDQELAVVLQLIRFFKWFVILVILYLLLPVLFSIFPMSRDWSEAILGLVMRPIRNVLHSTWNYLPNLFSILVIVIFMRYLIRFIRFIFKEIEAEKLEINGFHADWAMPTYNIVRFLLFAFTLVLIFPYLPGSDSPIFKGVTVFVGILFSLGSSSAVTNMIAGLVITYMRPFKPGDRIKIADVSGDVIEKTLLVTRIKTIKNEIITIPNASVLNGNTVNYSVQAEQQGLILHTTITLGYDLPWRKVHQTLIDAALATDLVEKEPKPYVLQTSLDDFYVSYQLNAYTKQASKQALAYSELHKNIQDFCRDRDIEIMSPHYRANRDGSDITIPKQELDHG